MLSHEANSKRTPMLRVVGATTLLLWAKLAKRRETQPTNPLGELSHSTAPCHPYSKKRRGRSSDSSPWLLPLPCFLRALAIGSLHGMLGNLISTATHVGLLPLEHLQLDISARLLRTPA